MYNNYHNFHYQAAYFHQNHAWHNSNWFQNNFHRDYYGYNNNHNHNYRSNNFQFNSQHNSNNRIKKRIKRNNKKNKLREHLKSSLQNRHPDDVQIQVQDPLPRAPASELISNNTYSDFRDNPSPSPQPININSFPSFITNNGYHNQQNLAPSVSYFPLPEDENDFKMIQNMITNKNFVLDSVERICNIFNENAYELKKSYKQSRGYVEEKYLFHGTKRAVVDDICLYNFNWRRCVNHKFGYGVNFSRNATYASWYSDSTFHKVMLIAKVLLGKSCQGKEDMVLPEEGCDTSHKDSSGSVIVKYEDNEFLPVFKLYYHFEDRKRHYNYW